VIAAIDICRREYFLVKRLIGFLLVYFSCVNSYAFDQFALSLDQAGTESWQLEGLVFSFSDIQKNRQKLGLSIKRIILPAPFDAIKLVDIQCPEIIVRQHSLSCPDGIADIQSSWLNSSKIPFNFFYSKQTSNFHLGKAKLAGGILNIDAWKKNDRWKTKLLARNIDVKFVKRRLKIDLFETFSGQLDVDVVASGTQTEISSLKAKVNTKSWIIQNKEASIDAQNLGLIAKIQAVNKRGNWRFSSQINFQTGSVYVEPLYVVAGEQPISVNADGIWQRRNNQLVIEKINILHPGILNLHAQGWLAPDQPVNLQGTLKTDDLNAVSKVYLAPFFTATAMEGIEFTGKLHADFKMVQQSLTDLQLSFSKLGVVDEQNRVGLQGGEGQIEWSKFLNSPVQSRLGWKKLTLFNLPVDASELVFSTMANSLQLDKGTALPFLGGAVEIHDFFLQLKDSKKPDIHFQGAIRNVSLAKMTEKLNWQPLTGEINGEIPGIAYQNDRLSIEGELKVQVFDGEIRIRDMAVSGLFSPLPKLYLDLDIERLDLNQLTRKFDFGNMQGRLSGEIRNLYLENWKPVTFFAWLGTPEDDDSLHRISQKAVNNLASIGGGGAVDVLSRTFLRFFETFGYDKVGIGCYLYEGVCQLMGVGPAEQGGYYIVKGGGLPRIDVIGYNPRVDWQVLLQRLSRISQPRVQN